VASLAAIYVGDWGDEPRAQVSSAVGARIEAPMAPRELGCGEGVSPFPLERGLGEDSLLPSKLFHF